MSTRRLNLGVSATVALVAACNGLLGIDPLDAGNESPDSGERDSSEGEAGDAVHVDASGTDATAGDEEPVRVNDAGDAGDEEPVRVDASGDAGDAGDGDAAPEGGCGPWAKGPTTFPAVFRSDATWLLSENDMLSIGAGYPSAASTVAYGVYGDVPVAGRWTGDAGVDTIGMFQGGPGNPCAPGAQWLLRNSQTAGAPDEAFCFGNEGDVPVVGDWDGDGKATIGVYRPAGAPTSLCAPGGAGWLLRNSNAAGPPDLQFCFGGPADTPIVGDWDGDGITTIGIYRVDGSEFDDCAPSSEWILSNQNVAGSGENFICFGGVDDVPIVGDWANDGFTSIGLFRRANSALNPSSNHQWLARRANDAGPLDFVGYFGVPASGDTGSHDLPLVGRWWPSPPAGDAGTCTP